MSKTRDAAQDDGDEEGMQQLIAEVARLIYEARTVAGLTR